MARYKMLTRRSLLSMLSAGLVSVAVSTRLAASELKVAEDAPDRRIWRHGLVPLAELDGPVRHMAVWDGLLIVCTNRSTYTYSTTDGVWGELQADARSAPARA